MLKEVDIIIFLLVFVVVYVLVSGEENGTFFFSFVLFACLQSFEIPKKTKIMLKTRERGKKHQGEFYYYYY